MKRQKGLTSTWEKKQDLEKPLEARKKLALRAGGKKER